MSSRKGVGPAAHEGGWQPLDDRELMGASSLARHRGDLEDLLQSAPDRPDLERLYQRDVPLSQILRLLGHDVEASQIDFLLNCADPRREIQRILDAR